MTDNIIQIVHRNNKWATPWGHEFNSKAEAQAFIDGMQYMKSNISLHTNYLIEKSLYLTKGETNE